MKQPNIELNDKGLSLNLSKGQKLAVRVGKGNDDISKALRCFFKGSTGRFGNYVAVANALVYRVARASVGQGKVKVDQDIIAVRLDKNDGPLFLGNASILPNIGATSSFGRISKNNRQTEVQERLSLLIPMVPFNVFVEAGLDLNTFEILDKGPEETVNRRYENPKFDDYDKSRALEAGKPYDIPEFTYEDTHFIGAALYSVGDKVFLFDIDRNEIEHSLFNPFLTIVPGNPKTIEEAYRLLKPNEVIEAEKQGLKVVRQGEWFFIPSETAPREETEVFGSYDETKTEVDHWDSQSFKLQAGKNRPNYAQVGFSQDGDNYVKGLVEHSGREHITIRLKDTWYKVVPNTAVESFTIEGDID